MPRLTDELGARRRSALPGASRQGRVKDNSVSFTAAPDEPSSLPLAPDFPPASLKLAPFVDATEAREQVFPSAVSEFRDGCTFLAYVKRATGARVI